MKRFKDIIHLVEQDFDKLNHAIRKRRGYKKGVLISAYHGYSNNENLFLEGRVLIDKKIPVTNEEDSIFKNIERMYKHFNSSELKGVTVEIDFENEVYQAVTDDEGYYKFSLPVKRGNTSDKLWQEIDIRIAEGQNFMAVQRAQYQSISEKTAYAIISDIDDTILQSGAHSLMKMIKTTFTKNANTRLTFSGVNHLYHGFQNGSPKEAVNPIFYLSNSPWNLFDFLDDFMELKGIPKGTLLLRDWGMDENKTFVDDTHKLKSITKILQNNPTLKFILIGDSGEKDPEYYQEIAQKFPDRIMAIYIRNVTEEPRNTEVNEIAKSVKTLGIPMMLIEDSLAAAKHAASMSWITEAALKEVEHAVKNNMA